MPSVPTIASACGSGFYCFPNWSGEVLSWYDEFMSSTTILRDLIDLPTVRERQRFAQQHQAELLGLPETLPTDRALRRAAVDELIKREAGLFRAAYTLKGLGQPEAQGILDGLLAARSALGEMAARIVQEEGLGDVAST